MHKKYKVLFFALLTIGEFAVSGCGKSCTQQVSSMSSVKNATGHALSLSVCVAGVPKAQTLAVPANQNGDMAIETHSRNLKITGNPASQCADQQMGSVAYLTSKSFGSVKFCHNLTYQDAPMQIIESTQTCPAGTSEQIAAVDDCLSLAGPGNSGTGHSQK